MENKWAAADLLGTIACFGFFTFWVLGFFTY